MNWRRVWLNWRRRTQVFRKFNEVPEADMGIALLEAQLEMSQRAVPGGGVATKGELKGEFNKVVSEMWEELGEEGRQGFVDLALTLEGEYKQVRGH